MDNHAFQTDGNAANPGNQQIPRVHDNQRPFTINRYQSRTDNNDYLVEVNSRAKLLKHPLFYKRLAICFLLLAIIFFIVMIVFISLYSKQKPKICTSNECLRTAANYKASIDYSVNPCEDFYKFACGKWSEEHPNHGWWSSFSSFTTITEKVAIASMNALDVDEDDDDDDDAIPEAVRKSRDFYKSCMDTETLDDLGIAVIYPYLTKIGLPTIPSLMAVKDISSFKFNWLRSDALAKNILLMDILMGATVGPNIFNGSQNVIYIGQIYQTSPLPSPVKKKSKTIKNRIEKRDNEDDADEAVKALLRSVNSNIISYLINSVVQNSTGKEAADDLLTQAADIIIEMSDNIDEIVTNTTSTDDEVTYTITIENLEKEINSVIKTPQTNLFTNYLNYLFNGTNVTINAKTDLLFVTEMDVLFLKKMMQYLFDIEEINIELYMWWASVYAMIINTSTDVSEFVTKQLSLFSSDAGTVVRSRSLECALLVNNYMGYAVSYLLADQTFPNVTKPKVERMVLGLKEAFVTHVNELSWMDSKTKKATLEKSKEMITFIGYPDWLFQKGKLDKHYKNIVVKPDTYLENMVNVIMDHAKTNLKSLRKHHQRDWYSEPIEVNAFNAFSDNAINVPMAILNFPMYHLGLEVLNYGSIGSILGHELTHGFDNTGRKHDKYGNFVQWWTNQTIEAFENFTDCFVKQYENFTIPGVEGHINGITTLGENLADNGGLHQAFTAYQNLVTKNGEEALLAGFEDYTSNQLFFIAFANINGKNTLGENLADNGGLNQAYGAYKNYVGKHGEEPKLPGFENYNNYQMFFIAYATIWCETTNTADLEDQLEYDEHCPNSIRVLGTLKNSEDFSREFKCPKGSPMNPVNKCKIW